MKINFQNKDLLNGNNNYKTHRKSKVGTMVVALFMAAAVGAGITNNLTSKNEVEIVEPYVAPFSASVSIEDINDMNVILNDCDCGNTFFSDVVENLENDGLKFRITSNCSDINLDNCTVITLDHQYSAGEGTIIFAPYNNSRIGNSDSLAISMQTAFDQNGFIVGDIACSQIGYSVNEDGTVNSSVPTPTEEAIGDEKDTSFVTISFGTQTVNAEWVAKSIENGLARQKYYLDNYDSQTDLIYRTNSGDSVDNVALYFGNEKSKLIAFNELTNKEFYDSQAVVNANVKDYEVFNRDSIFDIDGNKTKAY